MRIALLLAALMYASPMLADSRDLSIDRNEAHAIVEGILALVAFLLLLSIPLYLGRIRRHTKATAADTHRMLIVMQSVNRQLD